MLNIPNQMESKSQKQLVNNHLFLSLISVSSSVLEQDKDNSETIYRLTVVTHDWYKAQKSHTLRELNKL